MVSLLNTDLYSQAASSISVDLYFQAAKRHTSQRFLSQTPTFTSGQPKDIHSNGFSPKHLTRRIFLSVHLIVGQVAYIAACMGSRKGCYRFRHTIPHCSRSRGRPTQPEEEQQKADEGQLNPIRGRTTRTSWTVCLDASRERFSALTPVWRIYKRKHIQTQAFRSNVLGETTCHLGAPLCGGIKVLRLSCCKTSPIPDPPHSSFHRQTYHHVPPR